MTKTFTNFKCSFLKGYYKVYHESVNREYSSNQSYCSKDIHEHKHTHNICRGPFTHFQVPKHTHTNEWQKNGIMVEKDITQK